MRLHPNSGKEAITAPRPHPPRRHPASPGARNATRHPATTTGPDIAAAIQHIHHNGHQAQPYIKPVPIRAPCINAHNFMLSRFYLFFTAAAAGMTSGSAELATKGRSSWECIGNPKSGSAECATPPTLYLAGAAVLQPFTGHRCEIVSRRL